jgi:LmbE family N-acetylglucosaminyl deacetylase
MGIVDSTANGTNVVFVGAHPDDEGLVGPLLPFAADHSSAAVVCMTAGESGWNLLGEDREETLAAVRTAELKKACSILGASCEVLGYTNGLTKSHPEGRAVAEDQPQASARWEAIDEFSETPDEVIARWADEGDDPVAKLEPFVRDAEPCLVVSFDTDKGFTGHAEHVAAGQIAQECVARLAPQCKPDQRPSLYQFIRPDGAAAGDVAVAAAELTARGKRDYLETGLRAHAVHESQYGVLGTERSKRSIRRVRKATEQIMLRRVSPPA